MFLKDNKKLDGYWAKTKHKANIIISSAQNNEENASIVFG